MSGRPARLGLAVVNVGTPRPLADVDPARGGEGGAAVHSGIAKSPVATGTVLWLSLVNLAGDGQADLTAHGGRDKAVYAYPSEHLPGWRAELGEDLGPAPFGENLSTVGATEADVCIGDRWRWGDAVLQVSQPRWPCFKLARHRGRADIQHLFRASGRTGWYLRVLEPGEVDVDGPVEVAEPDPAGLSVLDAHRAMADHRLEDRRLVTAVAAHPALAAMWRDPLAERLAR